MLTPKQTAGKTNRISIRRNGRVFAVIIEGGIALLTIAIIAMVYIVHLFH